MIHVSLARVLRAAALVLPLSAPSALLAQHRFLSAFEYSVGIPIGDTRAYSPGGSWSGAAWEERWMDRPHTSIGGLVGFNEFHERETGTFAFPGGSATGARYQHLLMVPALVTGAYYFTAKRDDPRWYIGGGAGPVFSKQLFRLGLNDQTASDWGFTVVPEVGLAFAAWHGTGGIVSVRYHLPTSSGDFLRSGDRRFQYVSVSFGLGFR